MADFEKAAKFEHGFWLQVLGDHARFIHDSLGPQEQREIDLARYFIQTFDYLLARVQVDDLGALSNKVEEEGN